LKGEVNRSLLQDNGGSGFRQQVKQAIKTSLNNSSYNYQLLHGASIERCIFSIEVQEVCADHESRGVLFIITEKINEPEDIEQVLRIFSKIISNLLSRQDECIVNQVKFKNEQFELIDRATIAKPQEVVDLIKRREDENGNMQKNN